MSSLSIRKDELLWRKHKCEWDACQKCAIGRIAHKHVHARGQIPADTMFLGLAPGKTEDVIGWPFIGLAGKILNSAINEVMEDTTGPSTYCVANLLACRPTDWLGSPNRDPTELELENCQPRWHALIKLVSPSLIVLLGELATREFLATYRNKSGKDMFWFSLAHPAWIVRTGGLYGKTFKVWLEEMKTGFRERGVNHVKTR